MSCAWFWSKPPTASLIGLRFWIQPRACSPSCEASKAPVPTIGLPVRLCKAAACKRFARHGPPHFSSAWQGRATGPRAWRRSRTKVRSYLISRAACNRCHSGSAPPTPYTYVRQILESIFSYRPWELPFTLVCQLADFVGQTQARRAYDRFASLAPRHRRRSFQRRCVGSIAST